MVDPIAIALVQHVTIHAIVGPVANHVLLRLFLSRRQAFLVDQLRGTVRALLVCVLTVFAKVCAHRGVREHGLQGRGDGLRAQGVPTIGGAAGSVGSVGGGLLGRSGSLSSPVVVGGWLLGEEAVQPPQLGFKAGLLFASHHLPIGLVILPALALLLGLLPACLLQLLQLLHLLLLQMLGQLLQLLQLLELLELLLELLMWLLLILHCRLLLLLLITILFG
mmetsp:Transcript_13049/g.23261  ORF Transcript_13049/g.23261 Transcript_13049/m.23261 type:complete len:221 (+) Transcript_13049:1503-2165(+)